MPFSSNTFDNIFIDHANKLGGPALDIGAGAGKYGNYLKNNHIICDAVEPTLQYINDYNLSSIYRNVYNQELHEYIKNNSSNRYNITIFGDIIEHLFLTEAIDVIDYFCYRSNWIILIFPTKLPQDASHNNDYEIHKCNLTLADLNRFDVVYYLRNGGWEVGGENRCEFHYCVIRGYFTDRSKFVYNLPNWVG